MPAPLKDPIRPSVQRFRLGGADVTTILDGAIVLPQVAPPYATDMTEERRVEVAHENFVPADKTENAFTPTLVTTGGKLVLFDTGFGEMGHDKGCGHLVERMAQAGYAPEDVDVVALTHCHPDHIGGLRTGGEMTFPNARHVMGRAEFEAWSTGRGIPEKRAHNKELFDKIVAPVADRFDLVAGGDEIAPGLVAEEGFGHSPGHMMYRLDQGTDQLLIWGDVTNHFAFSLRHPRAAIAFDDNPEAATATRLRVLDMAATERILVAGHHMPFPSVGFIERAGESYRWVPMAYQNWI